MTPGRGALFPKGWVGDVALIAVLLIFSALLLRTDAPRLARLGRRYTGSMVPNRFSFGTLAGIDPHGAFIFHDPPPAAERGFVLFRLHPQDLARWERLCAALASRQVGCAAVCTERDCAALAASRPPARFAVLQYASLMLGATLAEADRFGQVVLVDRKATFRSLAPIPATEAEALDLARAVETAQ